MYRSEDIIIMIKLHKYAIGICENKKNKTQTVLAQTMQTCIIKM